MFMFACRAEVAIPRARTDGTVVIGDGPLMWTMNSVDADYTQCDVFAPSSSYTPITAVGSNVLANFILESLPSSSEGVTADPRTWAPLVSNLPSRVA